VSSDLIGGLRAQLARDGAMRSLVEAILDRCDRTGSMPGQITFPAGLRPMRRQPGASSPRRPCG
jgi:hypothetical protein